jgi:hypothetical protein
LKYCKKKLEEEFKGSEYVLDTKFQKTIESSIRNHLENSPTNLDIQEREIEGLVKDFFYVLRINYEVIESSVFYRDHAERMNDIYDAEIGKDGK